MSSHRKSIASKTHNDSKGVYKTDYNYQKEAKQLKKDLRIKDEKIVLLNKEMKYKKDTIQLLHTGINTKEEQLQLKDKEFISLEQNTKLLIEKSEILEKKNDELRNELNKQIKLANIAEKRKSVAEQNNLNLLQQLNSLAQNLNNLKNVNMALSSQLTMTMSAAQTSFQQQFVPNTNAANIANIANTDTNSGDIDEGNVEDDTATHTHDSDHKSDEVIPMIVESKTSGGDLDDNMNDNDQKEKTKRKKEKKKDRRRSDANKLKKKIQEESGGDWDQHYRDGHDYEFGNAPSDNRKNKKKPIVSFDTYLGGLDSDKLRITRGGRLINMDYFSDSLYIISSNGFSSAKHEWEIKALKTGDLADEIGICSDWGDLEVNGNGIADMGSQQLGARAVYANDPSTGVAFHDAYDEHNKLIYDKKFKKKSSNHPSEFVWSKGDIIKVSLNLNKWAVRFYLNNKQVGKSIALTKDLTYYPILCAYGNCSYQVTSCV